MQSSMLGSMIALIGRSRTLILVVGMSIGWATPACSLMLEPQDHFTPVAADDVARLRKIQSIKWPSDSFLEEVRVRVRAGRDDIDGRPTSFILIRVTDRCGDKGCPTFIFKETLDEFALVGLRHLPSKSASADVSGPACRFCTGIKSAIIFSGHDGDGTTLIFSRYGLSD